MLTEHPRPSAVAPPSPPGDEPQPRRRLVFAIVSMALFMASVDQTIVATALPTIQHDLHARLNWSGWTITIYALAQVLAMPLAGKLSDQYGRKKIFMLAAALFTTASLACGLANSVYLLVVLRAIQAIGGGAFMPSATGIVSDQFGRERDRALGMFTSIFPIGGIVGPVIGGVFVAYWSWRGIFLVNVPIGLLLIVLGIRYIPSSRRQPTGRTDIRGVVLLGVLLISAMLGISFLGGANASAANPTFWLPELVAVIALVAFLIHTHRHVAPFIPPMLLHGRGFGTMNLLNFFYGCAVLGLSTLVPLYAEQRYGIHELAAGTLLTARAVGMIAVAGLAVIALRRTGYRWPMAVGFTIAAVGLVLMSVHAQWVSPYLWLAGAAAFTGIGMGMATPASNNATLQLATDQVAAVAGLRGMFRQAGAITAVSISTAVVARSANQGATLAHVFLAFAIVMACTIPLIFTVPDHRGSW